MSTSIYSKLHWWNSSFVKAMWDLLCAHYWIWPKFFFHLCTPNDL